ncbi:transcriptional repressor scratch 2-like [Penaeus monodon]|uniref:transcriptional repressor scratch 2-like n=1 Tax=Penaeus monodon TaxID=6687 RepID=UPI0018A722A4|nr:transcriptional repressor scratch 2-like [Penaeus monodon]
MGAVGCGGTAGGGGGGSGGGGGAWEGPAACPVCLKVLSNKYNLRTHMEDKHSPLQHVFPAPSASMSTRPATRSTTISPCATAALRCPRYCYSWRGSGRVLVDNKPKWQCPVCYKLLSTRSNLKIHVQDKHSSLQHAFPAPCAATCTRRETPCTTT